MTQIRLIRHAPVAVSGRLFGRTDVAAALPARKAPKRGAALGSALLLSSAALRCRQTADWLWQGAGYRSSASLWEQDFGAWEGLSFSELPDLGSLPRSELARHRPPGGESFADLGARVAELIPDLAASPAVEIVAHAGVIRACLGLALGRLEDGLAFAVAPLSETRLSVVDGQWSILTVNRPILAEQP